MGDSSCTVNFMCIWETKSVFFFVYIFVSSSSMTCGRVVRGLICHNDKVVIDSSLIPFFFCFHVLLFKMVDTAADLFKEWESLRPHRSSKWRP